MGPLIFKKEITVLSMTQHGSYICYVACNCRV